MIKNKRLRRGLWIGGALAALALIFIFIVSPRLQAPGAEANGERETVEAFIGDLSATASAGGRVVARRTATLAVDLPGVVRQVNVRVGDAVQAGDVLLVLDATSYELNVAAAEQNVAVQQANLDGLRTAPAAADIAAAEAAVAGAEAGLVALTAGPREAEVAAAEANLRAADANVAAARAQLAQAAAGPNAAQIAAAEAELAQAQAQQVSARLANEANPTFQTDQVLQAANEAVAVAQARLNALRDGADRNAVAAAAANVDAAMAQQQIAAANLENLQQPGTASQIASSEAQLAQAEAALAGLREPVSDARLRAAEAQLAQAEISLTDARDTLARTQVVAPFDGVITAVGANPGEVASGPVIELLAVGTLEVVLAVDELDVGQLAVGQQAAVTIEPWPETEIETVIASIAPGGANSGALVTYDVRLPLDNVPLPIRAGMTANANLVTSNREGVLLVANRAIRLDRQTGISTVNVVTRDADGNPLYQEVQIRTGLRDNQYTQILDGLNAGDELLVGDIPVVNLQGGPFGN